MVIDESLIYTRGSLHALADVAQCLQLYPLFPQFFLHLVAVLSITRVQIVTVVIVALRLGMALSPKQKMCLSCIAVSYTCVLCPAL